jgi:hypothetical protein
VGVRGVDADREDLDVLVGVLVEVFLDVGELALAGAGEGERVEHQQHRLAAAEVAEPDLLVVLIFEGEVRRLGAHLDRHASP